MNKKKLIEPIHKINKSANPNFLKNLSKYELKEYLEHLKNVGHEKPVSGGSELQSCS